MPDVGVIVASTHHMEWLFPWWFNYSAHNDLPVAFFDLGMTDLAKKWCRERGDLISLDVPDSMVLGKEKLDPLIAQKWEENCGNGLWEMRPKFFKKPFVFASTPFKKTIWLDLDCEVRTNISSFLAYCDNSAGIALAPEPRALQIRLRSLGSLLQEEISYNSGVVVFNQNAPILSKWVQEVQNRNDLYITDQEALCRILFSEKASFQELPVECNWDMSLGSNSNAKIFHWSGSIGKRMIQEQIEALNSLGFVHLSLED